MVIKTKDPSRKNNSFLAGESGGKNKREEEEKIDRQSPPSEIRKRGREIETDGRHNSRQFFPRLR